MKKTILLGALMLSAAAGFAQESRQDVSVSAFGLIGPAVNGANSVYMVQSETLGALASYRYLLTPHSGLEVNYSFAQHTSYFRYGGNLTENPIHTRQQEGTVGYVYGLTFKRYNPFLEAGVGGVFFTPIYDGTYQLSTKRNTSIGGLFGGGVAYELSPSFDIRVEYRGLFVKVPNFGVPGNILNTNRYEVISLPAVGIAYHF